MQTNKINLTNVFVGALVSVFALGAMFSFATPAKAQTVEELQAMINTLMQQIAALSGGSQVQAPAMSYDFGMATLKSGSQGMYVSALQSFLNAHGGAMLTADGKFGPATAAAVKAWQASKGLTADGVFGPASRAAAQAQLAVVVAPAPVVPTTPAPTTPTLNGNAGDAFVTSTSLDVESEVKEGSTEKVHGFRIEAVDSDIQVTNLRVVVENNDAPNSSRLPSRYLSEISVWMDGEKVGSINPSDMTRNGNIYSRNVALDNAIVKEGQANRANFYIGFTALSNIDSGDMNTADWGVGVEQIRFLDGSGAIMTSSYDSVTNNGNPDNFGIDFTDLASSGDVELRASLGSNSPAEQLVKIESNSTTNNVTLLEFRLKAEGTDMMLESLDVDIIPVGDNVADMISELKLMRGSSTLADITSGFDTNDNTTDTQTFELYDEYMIEEGSTETFRVVAKIKQQVGNYASGDSIRVVLDVSSIIAEDENSDVITGGSLVGSASGKTQTLSLGEVEVTNVTSSGSVANNTTKPGYISFTFNVDAVEEDVVFADDGSDFVWTVTGTDTTLVGFAAPVLSKVSGDATLGGGNFTITEGDNATFVLDFTFTTVDAGDNGTYRITLNQVAGVTLDKLSPSVQLAH